MDSRLSVRRVAITLATIALVASACGGAAATPAETIAPVATPPPTAAVTGPEVKIDLAEWKVAMPSTVTAGQVDLVVTNDGSVGHELLVFKGDLAPSAYPINADGDIVEDNPKVNLISDGADIAHGGTQTRAVDLSQPGTYLFVCNLLGHFKAGMYQVVTVTAAPAAAADVNIDLAEWKVAVPSTLTAGQVNLVMKNSGTVEHELLVFKSDLPLSAYPKDASGDIVEDGPGVNLVSDGENIAPGGTQTRALDLSQPGTYVFVCNIPGHFKSGMYQVVTVTAP